jgi:hypothetical protein
MTGGGEPNGSERHGTETATDVTAGSVTHQMCSLESRSVTARLWAAFWVRG